MKKNILDYHRWNNSRGRSYYGSNQHPISAKIDLYTWGMMQDEQKASGIKINSLINLAVRWYIEELDEARRAAAISSPPENFNGGTSENCKKYILSQLTIGETNKLTQICRNLGMNLEDMPLHLVRMMLETYDEKPFLYL